MKAKTLVALTLISFSMIFFAISPVHAVDCTSVYGGGVVCPTATPTPTVIPGPQLPSAGVEDFVLPGFVTLLSAGLFLATKASQIVKS